MIIEEDVQIKNVMRMRMRMRMRKRMRMRMRKRKKKKTLGNNQQTLYIKAL